MIGKLIKMGIILLIKIGYVIIGIILGVKYF